jgi:hypothetical protein
MALLAGAATALSTISNEAKEIKHIVENDWIEALAIKNNSEEIEPAQALSFFYSRLTNLT